MSIKRLCPLNDFRDCVEDRCFFWASPSTLQLIAERTFEHPVPPPPAGCVLARLLLPFSRLLQYSGSTRSDVASLVDVLSASLTQSQQSSATLADAYREIVARLDLLRTHPQATPPAPVDLSVRRRLRAIEDKLDRLLRKESAP